MLKKSSEIASPFSEEKLKKFRDDELLRERVFNRE